MAKRHLSRKAAVMKLKTTLCLISALIIFSSVSIANSDIEKFAVTATSSGQTPAQLSYSVSGSSNWYPYYIANNPDSPGILSELIPKLLALAHVDGQKLTLPPKRTNKGLETGLLDFDIVSPSWFEHGDFGPLFVQSIPIMAITEHLVTLNENADKWQDIEQIKGKEIGTVRGYLYHDDALFTRIDFTSEQELIKALHKDVFKWPYRATIQPCIGQSNSIYP